MDQNEFGCYARASATPDFSPQLSRY